MPVAAFDAAVVVEAVAGIDPTIPAATKTVDHAVCIAAGVERAVENRPLVADAVAIGIFEMPDIRNAVGDAAALPGIDADRDVQTVGECRDLFIAAIAIGVFQDANGILP